MDLQSPAAGRRSAEVRCVGSHVRGQSRLGNDAAAEKTAKEEKTADLPLSLGALSLGAFYAADPARNANATRRWKNLMNMYTIDDPHWVVTGSLLTGSLLLGSLLTGSLLLGSLVTGSLVIGSLLTGSLVADIAMQSQRS